MTAPDKIWLDPACLLDADHHVDQCWHSENPGPCDECGMDPTEYTRTASIPTDARLGPVAQLERWASVAAELGDVVVACEIRTIIGENGNG